MKTKIIIIAYLFFNIGNYSELYSQNESRFFKAQSLDNHIPYLEYYDSVSIGDLLKIKTHSVTTFIFNCTYNTGTEKIYKLNDSISRKIPILGDFMSNLNRNNALIDINIIKVSGDNSAYFGIFLLKENSVDYSNEIYFGFLINGDGGYKIIENYASYDTIWANPKRRVFKSADTVWFGLKKHKYTIDNRMRQHILKHGFSLNIKKLNSQNNISAKFQYGKLIFLINDKYIDEIPIDIENMNGDLGINIANGLTVLFKGVTITSFDPAIDIKRNYFLHESFDENFNTWPEAKEPLFGNYFTNGAYYIYHNEDNNNDIIFPCIFPNNNTNDFYFKLKIKKLSNEGVFSIELFSPHKANYNIQSPTLENSNILQVNFNFSFDLYSVYSDNKCLISGKLKNISKDNFKEWNELSIRKINSDLIIKLNSNELCRILQSKTPFSKFFSSSSSFYPLKVLIDDLQYIGINNNESNDVEGPSLFTNLPLDHIVTSSNPVFILEGYVQDPSGVNVFQVNGKEIPITISGEFEVPIQLVDNRNQIKIFIKDRYGNTTDKIEELIFNRQFDESMPGINKYKGRNYLYFIAINDYQNTPLHCCINDAMDISDILINNYKFSSNYCFKLYDSYATLDSITKVLDFFTKNLTPNDNLLIYFTGHGSMPLNIKNNGFWSPYDVKTGSLASMLPNTTLISYLTSCNARHILVIADACFSGSLVMRSKDQPSVNDRENTPSRWAICSQRLGKAKDCINGRNSPFAKAIIDFLNTNKKNHFFVTDLIQNLKEVVSGSTVDQMPIGEPIQDCGHQGGEFVFYRR